MEEFDLPDIEAVEPTDEQEKRERDQLRLDMQRQEADDERRWEGIELLPPAKTETIKEGPYAGFNVSVEDLLYDMARAKKCLEERKKYVKQRDRWVEKVVGPIRSKKKSKADRRRLEAEG